MLLKVLLVFLMALVFDYKVDALSYNYLEEVAQAYCASKQAGWTFALKRDCKRAPTCAVMCLRAKAEILKSINHQRKKVSCFGSIYVGRYTSSPPRSGRVNLKSLGFTAKRNGCYWKRNHCGPNFCCCKAYN